MVSTYTFYLFLGEMGILLAGGCDESCHEHLDDTLFFPFSTQKWEVLDAKVNYLRNGTETHFQLILAPTQIHSLLSY